MFIKFADLQKSKPQKQTSDNNIKNAKISTPKEIKSNNNTEVNKETSIEQTVKVKEVEKPLMNDPAKPKKVQNSNVKEQEVKIESNELKKEVPNNPPKNIKIKEKQPEVINKEVSLPDINTTKQKLSLQKSIVNFDLDEDVKEINQAEYHERPIQKPVECKTINFIF